MNKIDRRKFIATGVAGLAGITVIGPGITTGCAFSENLPVDMVKLGNTGLKVSRIAMGTGTVGYNKGSNQTRLGMEKFVKMAHHAYEMGIRSFDMADGYGSHPYVGEAIKTLPREKVILLTKIWTHPDGSDKIESVEKTLDRYRQEINTDYIDILMLHCLTQGNWTENRKHYIDGLSKAKQDGIVKKVGVSCHHLDALTVAAENPWVDVIMARLNPFGTKMDGTPQVVNEVLDKAIKNGKGIIGMKVFGEGTHISDDDREQSIKYVVTEGNVHCMTLGLESEAQMDDAVERVMRFAKS